LLTSFEIKIGRSGASARCCLISWCLFTTSLPYWEEHFGDAFGVLIKPDRVVKIIFQRITFCRGWNYCSVVFYPEINTLFPERLNEQLLQVGCDLGFLWNQEIIFLKDPLCVL